MCGNDQIHLTTPSVSPKALNSSKSLLNCPKMSLRILRSHARSGPERHGVCSGGKSHFWQDALSHHRLKNQSASISFDLLESRTMGISANSTITAKNELIMRKTCERAS